MIVLFDEGGVEMLKAYFQNNDLTLRLFCTEIVGEIPNNSLAADLEEPQGGGYAAIPLDKTLWTVGVVGGIATAQYPTKSFNFTGPLLVNPSVVGYFVTNNNNPAKAIFGQKGLGLFTPMSSADVLDVVPTFQLAAGVPAA